MSSELGRSRTQESNQVIPDNLVEVALQIIGEADGSFDSGDKIILYGRGSSGFDIKRQEIIWHQNLYFNNNKTWLFIPDDQSLRGNRIATDQPPEAVDLSLNYGNAFLHSETDLINLNASGTLWLGNTVPASGSQAIIADLPFPKAGVDIEIKATLKGHSLSKTTIASHSVSLHHNNINGSQIGNTVIWSGTGTRTISDLSADITPINGTNYFHFVNSSTDENSAPYLDYFELQYGRDLTFNEGFEFCSPVIGQTPPLARVAATIDIIFVS